MILAQLKTTLTNDYPLSNSDLETIINCTNLTIDPTSYALLQKAQPTSAAVERSFSMLNKLLRKDRNFDVKNVKKYRKRLFHRKFRLPKFENRGLRNRKHTLMVPLL